MSMPNDPAIVTSLADQLATLITNFKAQVDAWQEQVDAVVVQLQNAGSSTVLPDGSVTGQVPGNVAEPAPAPEPEPVPEPEPLPPEPAPPSAPPEDEAHNFTEGGVTIHDPSGDDTIYP